MIEVKFLDKGKRRNRGCYDELFCYKNTRIPGCEEACVLSLTLFRFLKMGEKHARFALC